MLKRILATSLAVLIALGTATAFLGETDNVITSQATPELEQYQQQLDALQQQQEELNGKIENASGSLEDLKQKKQYIEEQIKVLEEKIYLVDTYTQELEVTIADIDLKIYENSQALEDTEAEIQNGVAAYQERLRALYIAGNSSYANVLIDSDGFYDMLMRMELIKRVSEHDNSIITGLVELEEEYKGIEDILNADRNDIADTIATYQQNLSQLSSDKAELDRLKSENEQSLKDIEQQIQDIENQLNENSQAQSSVSQDIATYTTTTTTTTTTTRQPENNGGGNGGNGYNTDVEYTDGDIEKVVEYAKGMVGGRYVWCGEQYAATDCSGLVLLSYRQIGISLPHKASWQASYGTEVSYEDMQPGDLIFYGNGSSYSSIYHVSMYIGNGLMVHAESTATGIVISHVRDYAHIVVIKRLV